MKNLNLTASERQQLQLELIRAQNSRQYRRILAILDLAEGKSTTAVAAALQVTRQTVYNWVNSYMAAHNPQDLADAPRPGRPTFWTDKVESFLRGLLDRGRTEPGRQGIGWTVPELQKYVRMLTAEYVSDDTIRRALARWGYKWQGTGFVRERKSTAAGAGAVAPANSGSSQSGSSGRTTDKTCP